MEPEGSPPPPASRAPGTNSTSILGNFLRGRPRNHSQSHILTDPLGLHRPDQEMSASPPASPHSPLPNSHHGRRAAGTSPHAAMQNSSSQNAGLTGMLRRRRSGNNITPSQSNSAANPASNNRPSATPPLPANGTDAAHAAQLDRQAHRIRLVPHIDSRRSLRFEAITRTIKPTDAPLRIGRFTDRSGLGLAAVNAMSNNKLAFKSKVVSRSHAEITVEESESVRFYIRDTKSSSGTFLNHMRLSPAGTESRKFELHDGDILQLGVDYQGGTEDIYKSVKIRVELGAGREWQSQANAFNTNALKNLKTLAAPSATNAAKVAKKEAGKASSTGGIPDCCICLFSVSIRQALFIAPCSHTFHYKCIRPLLETHHPAFSCPLCRTYADLEEDVEVESEEIFIPTTSGPATAGERAEQSPEETPPPVPPRDNIPAVVAANNTTPRNDAQTPQNNAGMSAREEEDLNAALLASEVLAAAHSQSMSGRVPGRRDGGGDGGAETEVENDNPFGGNTLNGNARRRGRGRNGRGMELDDERELRERLEEEEEWERQRELATAEGEEGFEGASDEDEVRSGGVDSADLGEDGDEIPESQDGMAVDGASAAGHQNHPVNLGGGTLLGPVNLAALGIVPSGGGTGNDSDGSGSGSGSGLAGDVSMADAENGDGREKRKR